jgi:hypothetical protein
MDISPAKQQGSPLRRFLKLIPLFAALVLPNIVDAQTLQMELSGEARSWLGSPKIASGWVNLSQSPSAFYIEATLQPGGLLGTLLGWWHESGHWWIYGVLTTNAALRTSNYMMTSGPTLTRLSYSSLGTVTVDISPPVTKDLHFATEKDTQNTADELTAYFALSRFIYIHKTCDIIQRVFDGIKRFDLSFADTDVGDVSDFSGHAWSNQLKACQISRRDIAGYPAEAVPDPNPEVKGTIWLVPVEACKLMLPVKISGDLNAIPFVIYTSHIKYCGSSLGL